MYKKTILDNGLSIVSYHMPNRISITVGIWIKAGSRYEQKDINGISHFLEHLLFKGTQKRSCEQIKQAIEGIGGSLNAFTAEEFTCYLAKVPGQHLSSALEVLWDMVLNARLTAEDIAMERRVILEEIRMYQDLPGQYVSELLNRLLWPAQPLGMNISGEIKTVQEIKRKQLLSFRDRFYQLNNIVVAVCGKIDHQRLVEECQGCIRKTSGSKKNQFSPARIENSAPKLKFQIKDTEQTHLALGVYGLARAHRGRYAIGLLHIILGANMSSRLFREIRELRGLAYDINTTVKFFQDTGTFLVQAGVDNRRIIEAIDVILQQLRKIRDEQVDRGELKRAKEYYIGQLTLALESTAEHMLWLGENFTCLEKFLYPEKVIRCIEQVTVEDIQNLATDILQTGNLNLALIGPLQDKEKKRIKKGLIL